MGWDGVPHTSQDGHATDVTNSESRARTPEQTKSRWRQILFCPFRDNDGPNDLEPTCHSEGKRNERKDRPLHRHQYVPIPGEREPWLSEEMAPAMLLQLYDVLY